MNLEKLKIVYMGTPDFAAVILGRLLEWEGGEVVGVYTQPDRPCGRGQQCKPSPVKKLALEHGLNVYQPVNFKSEEAVAELKALEPDVLVVAAYGLILPRAVLDIPKLCPLNAHASLLPKYRGAAPIQRVILDGAQATGMTIMEMEEGLDSGPIRLQRALAIGWQDTGETIHDQLAHMGGETMVEALELLKQGRLGSIRQDDALATYAPKLTKEEGFIDWNQPAEAVHNRVRAMFPWPGAYFFWNPGNGKKAIRLNVRPGTFGDDLPEGTEPGTFLGMKDCKLAVACADKEYLLETIQPQGKKPMTAEAFSCGYLSKCGDDAGVCSGEGLE